MPWRAFLTKEMAEFLGVLAHPHRVRIVQELRNGEMDVNSLQNVLEISHSRVSQHLSVLRSHRVVTERRDGRHVYYRLLQVKLAQWLVDGLDFLNHEAAHQNEVQDALRKSRCLWSESNRTTDSVEHSHTDHHADHQHSKANGKANGKTNGSDNEGYL
ncbi:MAG: helix-turn-helix transcriptional regulator [Acidobacteria bacterium]|nr:helix-turn-helix transcriptional regulator [Acidobacteriota bacterium]